VPFADLGALLAISDRRSGKNAQEQEEEWGYGVQRGNTYIYIYNRMSLSRLTNKYSSMAPMYSFLSCGASFIAFWLTQRSLIDSTLAFA
jgi:hypothetical protein